MDIVHVRSHKKIWLPLLLVGDESEAMIDRYLERGELFVLHDPDARGRRSRTWPWQPPGADAVTARR